MARLLLNKTTFNHKRHAPYATDITCPQTNRPSSNRECSNMHFSNMHRLYGFKTKVSVLPNDFAVNVTRHDPGAVSNIDLFGRNITFHSVCLQKADDDLIIADIGPLAEVLHGFWAAIMDNGYQGAAHIVRAVLPKKKWHSGVLTSEQGRTNARFSSDKIIVENYFGRQCFPYNILGSKYKLGEKSCDVQFRLSVCFTNMHIKWHPLRNDDGHAFRRYKNRLNTISIDTAQMK